MRGQLLIPCLLVFGGCSFDSSGLQSGIGAIDARAPTGTDAAGDRPIDAAPIEPMIDAAPIEPMTDAAPDAAGPDATLAACQSDEDYTPNSNNGNSYKVIQGVLYWADAKAACEAEEAHLAVIEDDAENAFLKTMVENNAPANAWIGLSDQLTEGTFVWVGGQPLGMAQWAPGEPNNETDIDAAGEHCVFMVAGGDDGGMWNDAPCMHDNYRLRSVCECDGGGVDKD